MEKADSGIRSHRAILEQELLNDAALMLHQTVERTYNALLLTLTLYTPKTHNIKFLRSVAEDIDRDLAEAWPRDRQRYRTAFELLKRAYNDSRYSKHYKITREQLDWLGARAERLLELVETACDKRLAKLKAEAGIA